MDTTSSPNSGGTAPTRRSLLVASAWAVPAVAVAAAAPLASASTSGSPNLTPQITASPTSFSGTSTVTLTVAVKEITGSATDGSVITVFVSKESRFSEIVFDPSLVNNSSWTLDATSNSSYYRFTASGLVLANSQSVFQISGTFRPGATTGTATFSSIILGGSGGETPPTDNVSATTVSYAP